MKKEKTMSSIQQAERFLEAFKMTKYAVPPPEGSYIGFGVGTKAWEELHKPKCPICKSKNVEEQKFPIATDISHKWFCLKCGHRW